MGGGGVITQRAVIVRQTSPALVANPGLEHSISIDEEASPSGVHILHTDCVPFLINLFSM